MWDIDSHPTDFTSSSFGLGKTWAGTSKHITGSVARSKFSDDQTLPKRPPQTWVGPDDVEPATKVPAPSRFSATDLIRRLDPDPLLTVTPEKSLGLSRIGKSSAVGDVRQQVEPEETTKKGKQRVRFAPGTRTSPPSKTARDQDFSVQTRDENNDDDDSVPHNFSSVSEKLYQPSLYADSDSDFEPGRPSETKARPENTTHPSGYAVETQGERTMYVPVRRELNSEGNGTVEGGDKPIIAKVVRHRPAFSSRSKTLEDQELSVSDMEVKDMLANKHCLTGRSGPHHADNRSRSTSPYEIHREHKHVARCDSSSPTLASVRRKSPVGHSGSRSPTQLPSTDRCGPQFLVSKGGEKLQTSVNVVREAPHQPYVQDYLFPFDTDTNQEENKYDSELENPLARPEFNSALKISEDLKSVKERKPDTWGAVSKTLQTSDKKRTEIQEKASLRVNVESKSDLFSGLVDIHVPLDDICQNLEREKTLQAPPARPFPVKVPVGKVPDIMEFFPLDLQRELPDLMLTGIQPVTESLSTANPLLAFDLYRHNRAWEGVADS